MRRFEYGSLWQRSSQTQSGKNHKKIFPKNAEIDPFQPEEIAPGLRHPTAEFFNGKMGYYPVAQYSYINWDTSKWGKSGVRVEK